MWESLFRAPPVLRTDCDIRSGKLLALLVGALSLLASCGPFSTPQAAASPMIATVGEPSTWTLDPRPQRGSDTYSDAPMVTADLSPAQALAQGVRTTLETLPPSERIRLLSRWVSEGPPPVVRAPVAMAEGGFVTEAVPLPLPAEIDLVAVMGALLEAQGSEELAAAAFFVGPEVIARAASRVRRKSGPPPLARVRRYVPRKSSRGAWSRVADTLEHARVSALAWPVEPTWRVSSVFGPRVHPVTGRVQHHAGVDIAVPEGTEIRSAAAGIVRKVRRDRRNGRWIEVDHGNGLRTVYCHLSKVNVRRRQRVDHGAMVAWSGRTGRVTGPHLHYQLRRNGRFVDPLALRVPAEAASAPLSLIDEPTAAGTQTAMR